MRCSPLRRTFAVRRPVRSAASRLNVTRLKPGLVGLVEARGGS